MIQPRTQKHHTQTNRPGRGRAFAVVDSDEAEDPAPRKSSAVPSAKAAQNQVTHARDKAPPLFFDSDEDDKNEFSAPNNEEDLISEENVGEFNDDAMTLQSSTLKIQEPSTRQTKSSKPTTAKKRTKKTPVIVDDDSDDGATFKGFRGKKRGTR
jgi:hypothetical protein